MGVKILENKEDGYKALYDSVTMTAFGPVFAEDDDVEDFLEWCPVDVRILEQRQLDDYVHAWRMEKHPEKY